MMARVLIGQPREFVKEAWASDLRVLQWYFCLCLWISHFPLLDVSFLLCSLRKIRWQDLEDDLQFEDVTSQRNVDIKKLYCFTLLCCRN